MFSYNPLWKILIDRNMNKTTFAENCGISRPTISKMSKGEYVDMKTLDKICSFLKCDIQEIIEHIPN